MRGLGLGLGLAFGLSPFAASAAPTAGIPTKVSYSAGPASIACSDAANSVSSRLPISSIIPPRPNRARRPVML